MTQQDMTTAKARIDAKLTAAVAAKLHCPVTLARWIQRHTGDVPVFAVPAEKMAEATGLGLTVEAA